jgi:hypothetical protein
MLMGANGIVNRDDVLVKGKVRELDVRVTVLVTIPADRLVELLPYQNHLCP